MYRGFRILRCRHFYHWRRNGRPVRPFASCRLLGPLTGTPAVLRAGKRSSMHFFSIHPTLPAVAPRRITTPRRQRLRQKNERGLLDMTEKSETEILLRRKIFSILGLATLVLAISSTVLTVSRAEAQAPSTPLTPQTGTIATPQTGRQQRRLARRQARTERRQASRQARTERRQTRRQARLQRRQTRRGTNPATPR